MTLELAPILDLRASAALLDALRQRAGQDIVLDASGVQRVGGQCLQGLLAARQACRANGQNFTILNPSPEFLSCIQSLGADDLLLDAA